MSSAAAEPGEFALDAPLESLAERLSRAPLSLPEALRHGAEIASALRDLHEHGLAYGAVSLQWIEIGPAGAALRPTGGLKRLGAAVGDVLAFGAVLEEMLRAPVSCGATLTGLREQACVLALACRTGQPDMQQVLIALRLLGMQARQCSRPVRRPVARPVVAAPARGSGIAQLRLRVALHWKPLANLAAFALSSGK